MTPPQNHYADETEDQIWLGCLVYALSALFVMTFIYFLWKWISPLF